MFRPDLFRPMPLWANVSAEGGTLNCEAPKGGRPKGGRRPKISCFFPFPTTIFFLEAPAAPKPPGLHRHPKSPNVHISGPRRFKNTTKIPLRERRKKEVREKKNRNFGRSAGGGVRPNLGRTQENLEHTPTTHPTSHLTQSTSHNTRQDNTTQDNTTQQHR